MSLPQRLKVNLVEDMNKITVGQSLPVQGGVLLFHSGILRKQAYAITFSEHLCV